MKTTSDRQRPFGIHSVDHFYIDVPDLAVAQKFYQDFGLRVEQQADRLVLRTFQDDHIWAYIGQANKKVLRQVCFGAYQQDIDALKQRVLAENLTITEHDQGFTFQDLDGIAIDIRVATKVTPDSKKPVICAEAHAGERGASYRRLTTQVRPQRLSHILLFTSDLARTIDFYHRTLGLNLSDYSEGIVAFMHAPHGADHHTVAFAQSTAAGFHHCSWDVVSLEEVGLGAMQMLAQGWDRGWGVGRHVLGSNYFYYVRDPWGSYCEYSYDIDYIPAGFEWPAANHDPEDSLYLWGPNVPEDFVVNYEIN